MVLTVVQSAIRGSLGTGFQSTPSSSSAAWRPIASQHSWSSCDVPVTEEAHGAEKLLSTVPISVQWMLVQKGSQDRGRVKWQTPRVPHELPIRSLRQLWSGALNPGRGAYTKLQQCFLRCQERLCWGQTSKGMPESRIKSRVTYMWERRPRFTFQSWQSSWAWLEKKNKNKKLLLQEAFQD